MSLLVGDFDRMETNVKLSALYSRAFLSLLVGDFDRMETLKKQLMCRHLLVPASRGLWSNGNALSRAHPKCVYCLVPASRGLWSNGNQIAPSLQPGLLPVPASRGLWSNGNVPHSPGLSLGWDVPASRGLWSNGNYPGMSCVTSHLESLLVGDFDRMETENKEKGKSRK